MPSRMASAAVGTRRAGLSAGVLVYDGTSSGDWGALKRDYERAARKVPGGPENGVYGIKF